MSKMAVLDWETSCVDEPQQSRRRKEIEKWLMTTKEQDELKQKRLAREQAAARLFAEQNLKALHDAIVRFGPDGVPELLKKYLVYFAPSQREEIHEHLAQESAQYQEKAAQEQAERKAKLQERRAKGS